MLCLPAFFFYDDLGEGSGASPISLLNSTTMRRNSLFVYYLLSLMMSTYQRDRILSEFSNNRNQFISKAGPIFVQPVRSSTSSLTSSFCFYILTKWGSSLDNNIPMTNNRYLVLTYLSSLKIGATIGLQEF